MNKSPAVLRMLLVDDQTELLTVVGDYFRRLGYEVHATRTCRAALRALETHRPSIVITDLCLGPDDDRGGFELIRSAREQRPAIPVVLITGHVSPEIATEARRLGAAAVLGKPARLVDLLRVVLSVQSRGD